MFNWWLVPTLVLAGVGVWLGRGWMRRVMSPSGRMGALIVGGLAALPALLYAGYYAFHPEWGWYYELRSIPGSELLAAGAGLLAGMVPVLIPRSRLLSVSVRTMSLTLLALVVLVPHLKPLIHPVNLRTLRDTWDGDVCLQSSGTTCGPACAAMLARQAGVPLTEAELARAAFTSCSGTENWYLARALRARGLHVRYHMTPPHPARLPVPAIAGIHVGHFIAILGETDTAYRIANPLTGLHVVDKREVNRVYDFTGFFMEVSGPGQPAPAAR